MKKINVVFLLDKDNNWIEPFLLESKKLLNNSKFTFKILHNHAEVKNQNIVFILGYTKILNETFLKSNDLNLVIHESNLPKGKGFSPVQWQILEGKKYIPVYLIEATNDVDSGDILYKYKFRLTGFELYSEIREKQAKATIRVITSFLERYPNYVRVKQKGVETFYPKRTPIDSELNIDKTLRDQFNLLRIADNDNWPSFFYFEGKKYFLKIYPS